MTNQGICNWIPVHLSPGRARHPHQRAGTFEAPPVTHNRQCSLTRHWVGVRSASTFFANGPVCFHRDPPSEEKAPALAYRIGPRDAIERPGGPQRSGAPSNISEEVILTSPRSPPPVFPRPPHTTPRTPSATYRTPDRDFDNRPLVRSIPRLSSSSAGRNRRACMAPSSPACFLPLDWTRLVNQQPVP